jgi:hypothetical protein
MTTQATIRNVVTALTVSLFATLLATAWSSPALADKKKPTSTFGDIKGESIDDHHKDWVEILSYDQGKRTTPNTTTRPLTTGASQPALRK